MKKKGLFHLNKESHVCSDFLALDSNGVILIYNCLVILKNVSVNVPFSMDSDSAFKFCLMDYLVFCNLISLTVM